jgi:hypothetical protein
VRWRVVAVGYIRLRPILEQVINKNQNIQSCTQHYFGLTQTNWTQTPISKQPDLDYLAVE